MIPGQQKIEVDGSVDFSGGMDFYTNPSLLAQNQSVYNVNCQIKDSKIGISTRPGFREISLNFEKEEHEEIYRDGNIQGDGSYYNGFQIVLVVSVDGYIFEFKPTGENSFDVRLVSVGLRNNPKIRNVYISPVPFGCIINDGESGPIYGFRGSYERVRGKYAIGAGLMGIYLQNRFFYVLPDRKQIYASTIVNPTSLEEAYLNNIFGFRLPEDQDFLTAIGQQKFINKNASGGVLTFASNNAIYSADARGPRAQWGTQGANGTGFVSNSIPELGAVSGYSFEPLNGNLFYRNSTLGVLSLQYAQFQFVNEDTTENLSFSASKIFDNDHPKFLDSCYTKAHNRRLYTTVSPSLRGGGIYWNGIVVMHPQNDKIRFDSIYTGIRPWTIHTTKDQFGFKKLYVHSYDYDGVNRLYALDDKIDYDITSKGKSEIESQILTRCYSFKNPIARKKASGQFYSIGDLSRTANVNISSRNSDVGELKQIWDTDHLIKECCIQKGCFVNTNVFAQSREVVPVPENIPGDFHFRQDLFKIKGPFTLKGWVRQAIMSINQQSIYKAETQPYIASYTPEKIFSYKLRQ